MIEKLTKNLKSFVKKKKERNNKKMKYVIGKISNDIGHNDDDDDDENNCDDTNVHDNSWEEEEDNYYYRYCKNKKNHDENISVTNCSGPSSPSVIPRSKNNIRIPLNPKQKMNSENRIKTTNTFYSLVSGNSPATLGKNNAIEKEVTAPVNHSNIIQGIVTFKKKEKRKKRKENTNNNGVLTQNVNILKIYVLERKKSIKRVIRNENKDQIVNEKRQKKSNGSTKLSYINVGKPKNMDGITSFSNVYSSINNEEEDEELNIFSDDNSEQVDSTKNYDTFGDTNDSNTSSMFSSSKNLRHASANTDYNETSFSYGNRERFAGLMKTLEMLPPYPSSDFYNFYFKDIQGTDVQNKRSNPESTSNSAENVPAQDTNNTSVTTGKGMNPLDSRNNNGDSNISKEKMTAEEKYSQMTLEQWEHHGEVLTERVSKLLLKIIAFRQ